MRSWFPAVKRFVLNLYEAGEYNKFRRFKYHTEEDKDVWRRFGQAVPWADDHKYMNDERTFLTLIRWLRDSVTPAVIGDEVLTARCAADPARVIRESDDHGYVARAILSLENNAEAKEQMAELVVRAERTIAVAADPWGDQAD
jgi:hypothetical protein